MNETENLRQSLEVARTKAGLSAQAAAAGFAAFSRALANAAYLARWIPPSGEDLSVHPSGEGK